MVFLASLSSPVATYRPLRAIKVSLPQHLQKPVEKWHKPAHMESLCSWKYAEGTLALN